MDNQIQYVYSDSISNLPADVITRILACLSLKEAARTSLLSQKWRNRWIFIPKLEFDNTFSSLSKSDLFNTIYHILLSHPHPITSFSLCVSRLKSCIEIDHLMRFLSKRQIQELTLVLNFRNGELHRLSSSVFSFEQLCRLKLSCCVFRVPSSFEGFFNLKSIYFKKVDFGGKSFKQILSLCHVIEDITMRDCSNFESLVVGAPKLQRFYFSGNTEIICFTMSPVLSMLYIHPTSFPTSSPTSSPTSFPTNIVSVVGDIVESFACLPSLQTLSLDFHCLWAFFKNGPIPDSLPTKLDSIKVLKLVGVSWQDEEEASVMLCLIKSSPNLEELEIRLAYDFGGTPDANFVEDQDFWDIFSKLRELKLEDFQGLKNEMEFVKLVLGNAPNLELVDIRPSCEMNIKSENRILIGLTKFVRASSRATTVFHGSSN